MRSLTIVIHSTTFIVNTSLLDNITMLADKVPDQLLVYSDLFFRLICNNTYRNICITISLSPYNLWFLISTKNFFIVKLTEGFLSYTEVHDILMIGNELIGFFTMIKYCSKAKGIVLLDLFLFISPPGLPYVVTNLPFFLTEPSSFLPIYELIDSCHKAENRANSSLPSTSLPTLFSQALQISLYSVSLSAG